MLAVVGPAFRASEMRTFRTATALHVEPAAVQALLEVVLLRVSWL
jgi:hypothetical protein